MNRSRARSRTVVGAVLGAVLLAALTPTFVAAATRPVTIDLTIGQECIFGRASDNATVQLNWKNADGTRKAKTNVQATFGGHWTYCSMDGDVVEIGDRVRANDGGSGHLLVVPQLTLVINRVDNIFKGRGPAGDYVRLFCEYVNGFEPCVLSWKLKVNAQGKWGYKPGFDVVGWQGMSLRWKNDLGDFVWVGAVGPYVDVTIGSPIVRGATRANATATVVLRRAGSNNVAGTAVATGDAAEGKFQATFRNANGNKVKVRVGDRITSDVSPDEDWIVPNVMANANAATDEVTGTCPADSFFAEALVMRNGFPDGSHTWPEEDGSFTLDLSSVNVQSTETVRVRCYEYHPGDWVGRAVVAQ